MILEKQIKMRHVNATIGQKFNVGNVFRFSVTHLLDITNLEITMRQYVESTIGSKFNVA